MHAVRLPEGAGAGRLRISRRGRRRSATPWNAAVAAAGRAASRRPDRARVV